MERVKDFFKKGLGFGKRVKIKKDCLLALDIGTEFVKALVFRIERDFFGKQEGQGIVIGAGRQRQEFGHMFAGAVADIEGVALTCQRAIEQAVKMAGKKPEKAVVGVAGEFIKGSTTSFVEQRADPEEEIDLAELKNIIQKVQWKAFDKVRKQLAWETCQPEIEIKPINALITEIRIDGYQVTNPLEFQGKELFLNIFSIYAPLVHLRALENIVSKLGFELVSIIAGPHALTKSSSFNPRTGAIFIDIGGGTTDIALVRQGRVEGIKSFALAGRTFTKRLAQALNIGIDEAEEIKVRRTERQLSQIVQRKIHEILKKDVQIWLNGVELVLEEFDQKEFFPPLILLCGGGSLLSDIKNILKRETVQKEWLDKFPFSQVPQVNFIEPDQINNIIDETTILKGPENSTPFALASLGLEITLDERKALLPILRRAVRIMR